MEADAEIVSCMVETLQALEIERFKVRINNRKILSGALAFAGVPDEQREARVGGRSLAYDVRLETLRSLDKFDRVGFDGVAELLGGGRRDETGDFKFGVGLADACIEKLLAFLRVPNRARGESLEALRGLMGENASSPRSTPCSRRSVSPMRTPRSTRPSCAGSRTTRAPCSKRCCSMRPSSARSSPAGATMVSCSASKRRSSPPSARASASIACSWRSST
jgi:hypothetical protein